MKLLKLLFLVIFFIPASAQSQYIDDINWSDAQGYTKSPSVFFGLTEYEVENDTILQLGKVKGFTNFQDTGTTNGVYLNNATVFQGYLSRYNSNDGSLIDYLTFNCPFHLYMEFVEKHGQYTYVAGTFKDYMYVNQDTIFSDHPLQAKTMFIVQLDSNLELVNEFHISHNAGNTGTRPAFGKMKDGSLYVQVNSGINIYTHHLFKFDMNLNVKWEKRWVNGNNWFHQAQGLEVDENENVYIQWAGEGPIDIDPDTAVVNTLTPPTSLNTAWLVSLDSSGDYRWHYWLRNSSAHDSFMKGGLFYHNGELLTQTSHNPTTNLNPNGVNAVYSSTDFDLVRLNPSNGILIDHIKCAGSVLNSGRLLWKRFRSVGSDLIGLAETVDYAYLESNNSMLTNFNDALAIIKYDSAFDATVLLKFNIDPNINNVEDFDVCSDGGYAIASSITGGDMRLQFRKSNGQLPWVPYYGSLATYNMVRAKVGGKCVLETTPLSETISICSGDSINESIYSGADTSYSLMWYDSIDSDSAFTSFNYFSSHLDSLKLYVAYMNADSCLSEKSQISIFILDTDSIVDVIAGCDSISWIDGSTYSIDTSGVFITLTNQDGCDSIIELNLTLSYSSNSTRINNSCSGFIQESNQFFREDTTIAYIYQNIAGCDSTHEVIHQYRPLINAVISYRADLGVAYSSVSGYDSLVWSIGSTIVSSSDTLTADSAAIYSLVLFNDFKCSGDTAYLSITEAFDSIAVFDTTYIDVFDTIAVFDTTYIDVFDTIAVFDTTYIDVFDTIAVFDTTYIDVFDTLYITQIDTVTLTVMDTLIIDISLIGTNPPMFAYQLLVYPNPTRDFIFIDIPASLQSLGYSIEIVNALGQSIFVSTLNQSQLQVNLNTIGATGTYNLVIKDSTGIIMDTRVIILQ
jgi:hypothetical protein